MKSILTALLILGTLTNSIAQNDSPYQFKVKPGTEEWKTLTNNQEKINACSIPLKTLKGLSSKSLVETYLIYPLNVNQLAFETPQEGFKAVLDYNLLDKETGTSYSLYKELLNLNPGTQRKDLAKAVIKKYDSYTASQEESKAMEIYYLQMLMAQKEFESQLSSKDKKHLIETVLDKHEFFKDMPFKTDLEYSSAYLVANLLESMENPEFIALMKTDRFLKFSLYSGKQLGGEHWKKVLDIGRKQI